MVSVPYDFLTPIDLANRTYPVCPVCFDASPYMAYLLMAGFIIGMLSTAALYFLLDRRKNGKQ